ncbi:MAG: hypothetical protein Q9204_005973, partial [Flavoplaca sp. TL-2023a]
MAGIGEASAILTVATFGIGLSNSLIAYIGEVQDAPSRIQRIGNEVLATFACLKDIGEIVDKNDRTRTFSDEGVRSAIRCSEECKTILIELKRVLCKSGWSQQSDGLERDDIDISLFSQMRWPFLKSKLKVPRAELMRIKVDLTLLFTSAMVIEASSATEKAKYIKNIPGLTRAKERATSEAEQAKKRAVKRERGPRLSGQDGERTEPDPEMLQQFVEFQEKRMQEEEDKRLNLLLLEKEAQKKAAEHMERKLEEKILRKHNAKQAEIQNRNAEKKEALRKELETAGIEPGQIETVLESSLLQYSAAIESAIKPSGISEVSPHENITAEYHPVKWSLKLPWRDNKKSQQNGPCPEPGFTTESDNLYRWPAKRFNIAAFDVDTWLFDVFTQAKTRIPPSRNWIDTRWAKMLENGDVWDDFARLKPIWRTSILQFLTQMSEKGWILLSIEVPQRSLRVRLFRSQIHDPLVQLVLFRRQVTAAPPQPSSPSRHGKIPKEKPEPVSSYFGKGQPRVNIKNPHVTFQQDTDNSVEAFGKASRSRGNRSKQADTEENTAAYGRGYRPTEGPENEQTYNTTSSSNKHRGPSISDDFTKSSGKRYNGPEGWGVSLPSAQPRQQSSRSDHDGDALGTPMGSESPISDDSSEVPYIPKNPEIDNHLSRLQQRQRERQALISTDRGADGVRFNHVDTFNEIADSREPNVDTARLDQAGPLALRSGGSRRLEDYMQERVLNNSIRVRGYDMPGSVAGNSTPPKRLPTSLKSMREIKTERSRSHAREVLRSRMGRESEDEKKGSSRIPPKQSSSEDKPNDEETILRTLRRYTTFEADATPTHAMANANSSASTPSASSPKEVEVQASEAQTGQLHKNPVSQHSYMPLASAAPDLPRQVPLLTYEILEPGQSKGPDEEELETGHISGSPERYSSTMQDEPPEITAEDGSNVTFALHASRRHIEDAQQQDIRSYFAFGEPPSDYNNLYYRDSKPATPSDEAEKDTTSPERVSQVHE